MLLTVDDRTYGWGADVRALPENAHAYGPHVMDATEEVALAEALAKAGWRPSWRRKPTERVVFMVGPKEKPAWRQTLGSTVSPGQTLQVIELPKKP